jgi:hypothetical protein
LKSEGDNAAKLNGKVSITTGNDAEMTLASDNDGETETVITWTGSNLGTVRAIFPVPTGTYTLKAYLRGANKDDVMILNLGTKTITKNTRYGRTVTLDEVTGQFAKIAANAKEANKLLEDNGVQAVEVEAITEDATITIPANQEDGSDAVSLSLNSVSANASVSIVAGSGTKTVSKNVTIAAAGAVASSETETETETKAEATSATIKKLSVTLPASTVTLKAIGSTPVTYETVEVSTGTCAVILGANVTVNKISIASAGNVLVQSEAEVKAATASDTATIFYTDAQKVPSLTNLSKIGLFSEDVYKIKYAQAGATISLNNDITLKGSNTLAITANNMTLDLNGKTIEKAEGKDGHGLSISGATGVTVKNGTIKNSVTGTDYSGVYCGTGATATLDGVAIDAAGHGIFANGTGVVVNLKNTNYTNNSIKAVLNAIRADAATVTTNGTTLQSTASRGINALNGSSVTVTGGTVSSQNEIFYASASTITIDGPTSITNSKWCPIFATAAATVNLKAGALTNPSGYNTASIQSGSTFNMTGGSLTSTNTGIQVLSGSSANISGGTVTTSSSACRAISVEGASTLKISEASSSTPTLISSTNKSSTYQAVIAMEKSTLEMTGGSITNTATTAEALGIYNGSVATITGGSITSENNNALKVIETNKAYNSTAATIGGTAKLLSKNYNCVAVMPIATDNTDNYSGDRNTSRPAVTLTVQGNAQIVTTGQLSVDTYSAVLGNGMCHNTEINIEGGTLTSTGVGLYHPQIGTLNISGGTIEGGCTAVEVRAGTLKLTGGTLKSTASAFSKKKNGSGFTTTGAALSIAQHTYGDAVTAEGVASGNPTVTVNIQKGTSTEPTLESNCYAFYESNPNETTDVKEKVTLSITGGKFSGQVGSTDFEGFISGGSFKNFGDTFPSALIASGKALSSSATDDYYTIE